jgi:hypothetical protein
MCLKIVHADADAGVAKSLAGFLKSQAIPVELQNVSSPLSPIAGDVVLALWSRQFKAFPVAATSLKQLSEAKDTRHIMVALDKEKLPSSAKSFHVFDASRVGSREKSVWRDIAKLGKLAVASGKSYNQEAKVAYLKKPVATSTPETDLVEAFQPVPEQKRARKAFRSDKATGGNDKRVFIAPWVTLVVILASLIAGFFALYPGI